MGSSEGPGPLCAVLSVLISEHRWNTPMPKDDIVALSAVDHDYLAKEAYDELNQPEYPFVWTSNRGMSLNSGDFEGLADFLYYQCGWEAFTIKPRLKHYEGWSNHEWA